MKKIWTTATILLLTFYSLTAQNIGIGTNTPNASAALDVSSISKGLLVPRMTSPQRVAIASPANGLMVYDVTTNSFWFYNGNTWVNLIAGGTNSFALPYSDTVVLATTAFRIKNDEPAYTAIEGESATGIGVSGKSAEGAGITGTSVINNGVYGYSGTGTGVYAKSGTGSGLYAHSADGPGISAASNNNSAIVASLNNSNPAIIAGNGPGIGIKSTSNTNTGVEGISTSGYGMKASSVSGTGLNASSSSGFGISVTSTNQSAVYAYSNNSSPTIVVTNSNTSGNAINASSSQYHSIVGISAGTAKSGIWGESTGLGGNGVYGTSSSSSGYGVYGSNMTGTGIYGFSNTGTGIKALSNSGLALEVNGNIKISGGTTAPSQGAILTSDANGNASWKNNRVAFKAEGVVSDYNGLSTDYHSKIHFQTEKYDYANNYFLFTGTNPTTNTSTFTAPKPGIYNIGAMVSVAIVDVAFNITYSKLRIMLKRNGVTSPICETSLVAENDFLFSRGRNTIATDVNLLTGDIIWVEVYQSNSGNTSATILDAQFYAHLVIAD